MGSAFEQLVQRLYESECTGRPSDTNDISYPLRSQRQAFSAIDVDIFPDSSLRGNPTPTADILLQRAFVNSLLSHGQPSHGDHAQRGGSTGLHTLVFTRHTPTIQRPTHGRGPSSNISTHAQVDRKECPICREMVSEPKQCFAVPESGPVMTQCCVCQEKKDMRSEKVTLSCMHPLCAACFERMPSV